MLVKNTLPVTVFDEEIHKNHSSLSLNTCKHLHSWEVFLQLSVAKLSNCAAVSNFY